MGLSGLSCSLRGLDYDPSSRTIYAADNQYQRIVKVVLDGPTTSVATWSVFAGNPANSAPTGQYLNGTGTAAQFNSPSAVAYDAARGVLYVADSYNFVIRKIDASGSVTLHAGTPLVQGTSDGAVNAATFNLPNALTLDANGNLYVIDNGKIRKVTPSGDVTTLVTSRPVYGSSIYEGAASTSGTGIVRDAAGNLFVCEDYYHNVIDRISPDGTVSAIAGNGAQTYNPYGGPYQSMTNGVGTKASFSGPMFLAIDAPAASTSPTSGTTPCVS